MNYVIGKLAELLLGKAMSNNQQAMTTIKTGMGLVNSARNMYEPKTTGE